GKSVRDPLIVRARPVARSRLPRSGGRGEPHPGEPRGLLRLLRARLAGPRPRPRGAPGGFGGRRPGPNLAVCDPRAGRARPPTPLIMLGAAGAVVRWSAMAFDPPTALLPPLQCLHALSFGATHLGALGFMARAAPAELGATAQGYLAVALGLVMAAAMGISGL